MCDYPFFIPQVVLFANSSLFWFKVTNEHREFRNYLVTYNKYYTLPCKSQPSKKIPEYIVILQDFVVSRIKATAFAT